MRNRAHDVWAPCCDRLLRPGHWRRHTAHRARVNRAEGWLVVRAFLAMVAFWCFAAWLTGATS